MNVLKGLPHFEMKLHCIGNYRDGDGSKLSYSTFSLVRDKANKHVLILYALQIIWHDAVIKCFIK